jgi:hypothetical protein
MLVLAPRGVAYCLQSIDSSDPESISAARVLAMKLQGETLTDPEVGVLRLQTLLGYAPLGSPEAAAYRDELNAAWDALSAKEQDHLLG